MNKLSIIFAGCLSCFTVTSVHADTLLGGYIGINAWNMEVVGGFANQETLTNFSFDDETTQSVYIAFEHPVPLIPNIKLQRTPMDTNGVVALSEEFRFGDELFIVDTDLQSELDLTSTDIILYYELFDNDILSFDVGINGKMLEGEAFVQEINTSRQASEAFEGVIPMLYSKLKIGIPATGLSAYVEASYVSLDDNSLTDVQAAITYDFVETLAVDMSIEAGYRQVEVEIDDFDDVYANLEFDGLYIGLEFDF